MTVNPDNPNEFICANGTILDVRPVSALLVQERTSMVKYPDVPKTFNPDKDREEANPADPAYLAAIMEADKRVADIALGTYIGFGTKVISLGPNIEDCDSTGWSEKINDPMFGIDFDIGAPGTLSRYVFWMTHIILNDNELATVNNHIAYLGGAVGERAVLDAMATFPSIKGGAADTGVAANRQQRRSRNRAAKA